MTLYLLKASKFHEYQSENLRILRAVEGEQLSVRYSRVWIDPGLASKDILKQDVVLVAGDSPYNHFAPVRLGKVGGIRDEIERIEINVILRGYPRADLDVQAFNRWFSARSSPRDLRCFVLRDDLGVPVPEERDPAKRVIAWKASVDRLQNSDSSKFYGKSVFLLGLGLRDEESKANVNPDTIVTGKTYSQRLYSYNPLLPAGDLKNRNLGLEYDRTEIELLGDRPALEADGQIELRFRTLVPGTADLKVHVLPYGERSNQVPLSYHASGQVLETAQKTDRVTSKTIRKELLKLLDMLRKGGALDNPDIEQGVLEHMLLLAPNDFVLLRDLAHHHHRNSNHDEAVKVFQMVGEKNLAPGDWLPYFLSACDSQQMEPEFLVKILDHIAWDDLTSDQAKTVGNTVSRLPEGVILALLETLAYNTDKHFEDIWYQIRPSIRSPDGMLKTYEIMKDTHLDSPAGSYQYLYERSNDERIMDHRFDELMVRHALELKTAPEGFQEVLLRHLKHLVDSGKHDDAYIILHESRAKLSKSAFSEVRLELAESLADAGGKSKNELAANLFADEAEWSRVHGDLDGAVMHLERALHIYSESNHVKAIEVEVESALEASEKIQALREDLFSTRMVKLRDLLCGKRLLIVGGATRKTWADDLRNDLALSDVSWYKSDRGKPARTEEIRDAISDATGAVVVLTFHIGHKTSEAARSEARRREIPCALIRRGASKTSVLRGLVQELGM